MGNKKLNNALILLSLSIVILLNLYWIISYMSTDSGMEIVDLNNDKAKSIAVNLFFDKLKTEGELSLGLIGFLWALVVFKNNRIEVRSMGQIFVFSATNILFIESFLLYSVGYDFVLSRVFFHSSIDLCAPIITFWNSSQQSFFLVGVICLFLTLITCIKKEG